MPTSTGILRCNRLLSPFDIHLTHASCCAPLSEPVCLPWPPSACAVAVLSLSDNIARADDVADVQKLLSAGKNVEALQKADQFLSSKPRDPMMRFLRGISLSQAGRTAEAITAFQKLTEDFPELPEPFNNLAVLYAQQGQYEKSRSALEMAIRTNPSYATAYENLGDVYAKLASQAYSKALQIDTRSAVAPRAGHDP